MFYFAAAGMFFRLDSIVYLAIVVLGNSLGAVLMPLLAAIKPRS
jgi:hypothetical protein